MSCMSLSCLPWARVGISWVWKPSPSAALMVQIEFPWFLAGCFSPLHCIRVHKFVLSYTKLYISQNSAMHCFHSERCFFVCNTNDCISSLGFGGSCLSNMLQGASGYSIRYAMEWNSGTCSSSLRAVCCYRATIQQEPSRAASRTTGK